VIKEISGCSLRRNSRPGAKLKTCSLANQFGNSFMEEMPMPHCRRHKNIDWH